MAQAEAAPCPRRRAQRGQPQPQHHRVVRHIASAVQVHRLPQADRPKRVRAPQPRRAMPLRMDLRAAKKSVQAASAMRMKAGSAMVSPATQRPMESGVLMAIAQMAWGLRRTAQPQAKACTRVSQATAVQLRRNRRLPLRPIATPLSARHRVMTAMSSAQIKREMRRLSVGRRPVESAQHRASQPTQMHWTCVTVSRAQLKANHTPRHQHRHRQRLAPSNVLSKTTHHQRCAQMQTQARQPRHRARAAHRPSNSNRLNRHNQTEATSVRLQAKPG